MRYSWLFAAFVSVGLAAPLAAAEQTFRIRFGLTDQQPSSWDGSVTVAGGEVAALRSWRPREADHIEGASWRLATTEGIKFRNRNWEPEPSDPIPDYLYHPGLFLTVAAGADARVDIETRQGLFSFRLSGVPAGVRRSFLAGAVSVERASNYETVSSEEYENGFAAIAAEPDGAYWVAWVGYRDGSNRVFARRVDGAGRSEIQELTSGPSDVYRVRLSPDGQGGVWAVWSHQSGSNFDLWGRRFDGSSWSRAERLTSAPQPDIHHALAASGKGGVWLVWQGFRNGRAHIFARRWDGSSWSAEERISTSSNDDWNPAVAADSKGNVYVAWDTYDQGDFDVVMRRFDGASWSKLIPVAVTKRYEAYPSIACDNDGRVWIAWNESDTRWGKDTGVLVRRPAAQLYQSRWMQVAVYENGELREPLTAIEQGLPDDLRGFNDYPRVAADGSGRVWVLFRSRFLRQREVPYTAGAHRAAWETFATAFDGRRWSAPAPLPLTQGRSDAGLDLARGAEGRLYAAWATDNRIYDDYFFQHGEVLATRLPTIRGPIYAPRLRPRAQDELNVFRRHENEAEDVARIRAYEIRSEGKTYRIYRGDTHRHTEFSHDGNNDGSLNESYRYALNAAELDYLMVSEHNSNGGPDIEYINWLLQQRVDVFTAAGRFVPLYGYERSLGYPQGHRNVIFAERGNPAFTILPNEDEVGAQPLFEHLKQQGGISIPHTSATGMGTDWRDNDPEAEPLVEIFQGDRVSAEYEGAPFAATAADVTSQAGGFRPLGYVWNAWAKGYKLGVQASSDHLSTHFSYACTIAEELTREGLLDAMKKRHNYGATDNIILDYRMQAGGKEYLQGDVVGAAPGGYRLFVKVIGTAPIRQLDIIRNQEFIHTLQKQGAEVELAFVDNEAPAGENYYYVRVQQVNDQMAWSSPIWVTASTTEQE